MTPSTVYIVIALISAIPALLSILLFLWSRTSARDVKARPKSRDERVEPRSTRGILKDQSKVASFAKVARKFSDRNEQEAIAIVKKSLTNGDTQWRDLLEALQDEVNRLSAETTNEANLIGSSLTSGIQKKLAQASQDLSHLEDASQAVVYASEALVYGSWYTAIIKKEDGQVAEAWYTMGEAYSRLSEWLNREEVDFSKDAENCYKKAQNIFGTINDPAGTAKATSALTTRYSPTSNASPKLPTSDIRNGQRA